MFNARIHLNVNAYADRYLYAYRQWRAQFYDGCVERERQTLS
jgi:hypothetical protein